MIPSGSHTHGIEAADFRLPPGTALRYEQPAEALRSILPSYAVLDSDVTTQSSMGNWTLPGWARIWIAPTLDPPSLMMRNQKFSAIGAAMLFGVTSRAMPTSTQGGVSVIVDINPVGWARLLLPSADLLRDRMTPLDQLMPTGWTQDLVSRLDHSDHGSQVKNVLDDFFMERLPQPHPQEQLIEDLLTLLIDKKTHNLADAAMSLSINKRALLPFTKHFFGFPPKTLSMRTRFLRALTSMMLNDDLPDFSAVPDGYHDVSHYIKDANHFLGQTPRRFLLNEMLYMRAALRARMLVIGSPTSSLDETRPISGGRQKQPVAGLS